MAQAERAAVPAPDGGEEDAHLAEERTWSEGGVKISACSLAEKIINAKELKLRSCIEANYSRIREVEHELKDLQLQLKLTAGPKKSALEMLRKKIEAQTEQVAARRGKVAEAKQVLDAAEAELKAEEAVKERLCQELTSIVQQSANAELSKLEQLTQRLEQLGVGVGLAEEAPQAPPHEAPRARQAGGDVGGDATPPAPAVPVGGPLAPRTALENSASEAPPPKPKSAKKGVGTRVKRAAGTPRTGGATAQAAPHPARSAVRPLCGL